LPAFVTPICTERREALPKHRVREARR